jgi:hypothetical protein
VYSRFRLERSMNFSSVQFNSVKFDSVEFNPIQSNPINKGAKASLTPTSYIIIIIFYYYHHHHYLLFLLIPSLKSTMYAHSTSYLSPLYRLTTLDPHNDRCTLRPISISPTPHHSPTISSLGARPVVVCWHRVP